MRFIFLFDYYYPFNYQNSAKIKKISFNKKITISNISLVSREISNNRDVSRFNSHSQRFSPPSESSASLRLSNANFSRHLHARSPINLCLPFFFPSKRLLCSIAASILSNVRPVPDIFAPPVSLIILRRPI